MVHNAVILGMQVDTGRLWDHDDPDYELWLATCVDRVNVTRDAQARARARAGS